MGKKRKVKDKGTDNPTSSSSTHRTNNKRKKNQQPKTAIQTMWGGSSRSRGSSSRGSSHRSSSNVNEASIISMFADIADEDNPEIATMEGLAKLCEAIDIDPYSDIRVLVLVWKLGANKKPGQITKQEWIQGCTKLEVDSIDKIKKAMPGMDPGFITRNEFKSFYKFTFQFNREGTHRTLDREMVISLLDLVLKDRVSPMRVKQFSEFLENSKEETAKKINLDQWSSFLDFCYEYESDDLDDYDEEMSAWPVLIDDFVDYIKNEK